MSTESSLSQIVQQLQTMNNNIQPVVSALTKIANELKATREASGTPPPPKA